MILFLRFQTKMNEERIQMDAYKYDTEPVQKQEEKKTKQRLEICASKYQNRSHAFIQSDPKSKQKEGNKKYYDSRPSRAARQVGRRGPPPSGCRPPRPSSIAPAAAVHRPSYIPPPATAALLHPAAGHRPLLRPTHRDGDERDSP
jgi:hypothetical protein